jgi:competence protein ComEC
VERQPGVLTYLRALPLLWLSIAFIAGIIAGSVVVVELWLWLLLAGIACLIGILLRKRSGWLTVLSVATMCLLFLGAARHVSSQPIFDSNDLAFYNDIRNWAEVFGVLDKPAVQKDGHLELLIRAESISFSSAERYQVDGLLLARIDNGIDLIYGDRVKLTGELTTPPEFEDFSYRDYLARQGTYSLMSFASVEILESGHGNPFSAAMYALRELGVETLYKLYPAREAALLAGILLGDESGLSEKVKADFNDTGTRHIIAISGFNISIIAGLLLAVFGRWLGARRGIWAAGIGVVLYTLFVGADASVVRASLMGTLALVALRTGRQAFALNSLGISAALMALVNPLVLWDVGFQLSFAATLGLVLYAEPLGARVQDWMDGHLRPEWAKRLGGPVKDYFLLTLAAQIATLPILLYYFQRLSIFSLPANMLILPVQPALMILGGFSILTGMLLPPVGHLIAYFAWALATYTIRIVEFFASLPWSSQTLESFPIHWVLIWFIALAAISIPAIRQRIISIKALPAVGLAILVALALWTWTSAITAPDGRLRVTLLSLDGEALLVQTPEGRTILINAGSSPTQLLDQISRWVPGDQDLDWLIIAGQRSDQLDALNGSLDRISPENIAVATTGNSDNLIAINEEAGKLGIPMTVLSPGDDFDLGEGAHLKVVSVSLHGAILMLCMNNFEALLPLGQDFDQLEAMNYGRDLGPIDLLLLTDAGYLPLNPPEWIANLSPTMVWSTSSDDAISNEILNLVPTVFQTNENGWLQVTTDGDHMWFEVAHR